MPDASSNPTAVRPRRWTIFAAALLLLALALVVIYTTRSAFFSPLALVVVAAIGLAALLLQLRFRRDVTQVRAPFWLNVLGLICAIIAIFADRLHLTPRGSQAVALAAVTCFGISGVVVLHALRKPRP